jgi:hypothetical protein
MEAAAEPKQARTTRPTRCRYRTRSGAPCPTFAIPTAEDKGCFSHSQDPAVLESRRSARGKGGHNRSNVRRAMVMLAASPYADVAEAVQRAIQEVFDGSLDPARGSSIALLARSLVNVQDAAVTEARLDALERMRDEGPLTVPVFLAPDGTVKHES